MNTSLNTSMYTPLNTPMNTPDTSLSLVAYLRFIGYVRHYTTGGSIPWRQPESRQTVWLWYRYRGKTGNALCRMRLVPTQFAKPTFKPRPEPLVLATDISLATSLKTLSLLLHIFILSYTVVYRCISCKNHLQSNQDHCNKTLILQYFKFCTYV